MQNELILVRRVGREHEGARRELDDLLARVPVRPALVRGLAASAVGGDEAAPT